MDEPYEDIYADIIHPDGEDRLSLDEPVDYDMESPADLVSAPATVLATGTYNDWDFRYVEFDNAATLTFYPQDAETGEEKVRSRKLIMEESRSLYQQIKEDLASLFDIETDTVPFQSVKNGSLIYGSDPVVRDAYTHAWASLKQELRDQEDRDRMEKLYRKTKREITKALPTTEKRYGR